MDASKLQSRLRNWGEWLNYEANIGPKHDRCRSLESRFLADAGDVWEEEPEVSVIPNVSDAERLQKLISMLDHSEQYCLALRYGGMPAVFKFRRISDHAMKKMADNAEVLLSDMLKMVA